MSIETQLDALVRGMIKQQLMQNLQARMMYIQTFGDKLDSKDIEGFGNHAAEWLNAMALDIDLQQGLVDLTHEYATRFKIRLDSSVFSGFSGAPGEDVKDMSAKAKINTKSKPVSEDVPSDNENDASEESPAQAPAPAVEEKPKGRGRPKKDEAVAKPAPTEDAFNPEAERASMKERIIAALRIITRDHGESDAIEARARVAQVLEQAVGIPKLVDVPAEKMKKAVSVLDALLKEGLAPAPAADEDEV